MLTGPRSRPKVVSAKTVRIASFEYGAQIRAASNAMITSRSLHAGPCIASNPSPRAIAYTASIWQCGRERRIARAAPASIMALPASDAFSVCTAVSGRTERFARVSCLTFPERGAQQD